MVENILDVEEELADLISGLEKKHGIALTDIVIVRPSNTEEAPVGQLEIKTQWVVASKLDR